jgi:DNA-binding FadR family transcriptional regulator
MSDKIKNTGLSGRIFDCMQNDIIRGVYPVSSKLPPERELSLKYNASRFAVREAIAMLVQAGFVETQPQSGTYIKDFIREGSLETLVKVLHTQKTIDRKTLDSLLKFRYYTEVMAAGDAAILIKDNDIEYLKKNLEKKSSSLSNIPALTEADYDFHYAIITISGNIINQLVFKSFRPIYSFFTEFFYSLEGTAEASLKLNLKLLKALSAKNRNESEKAMSRILKHGEEKIYAAIKNSGAKIFL